MHDDLQTGSVPGGSLLAAALNRNIMNLADRGGASQIIGGRWADIAAQHADLMVGTHLGIPFAAGTHSVTRVVRLDDDHRIAHRASKKSLQNPDLIIFGERDGKPTMQAVDAKFSIETAKSKQVSVQMLEGLLTLGPLLDQATGGFDRDAVILPGLFFSPESPVTRHVMRSGRGIIRLTVDPSEIVLLGVSSEQLFGAGEELPLMCRFYYLDNHGASPLTHLLSGMYYFRLSRAAISAWIDLRRPLLALDDRLHPDPATIADDVDARSKPGDTAWAVVTRWIDDAGLVNRQREAIDRAAGLPVSSRELREWIETDAAALGVEAPSANQVRRRLGAWHRRQLRDALGPIEPPRNDIPQIVRSIAAVTQHLAPQVRLKTTEIIIELDRKRLEDDEGEPGTD